jgi:hypothetical protein
MRPATRFALLCACMAFAFVAGLHLGSANAAPRLVGFGCIGAAGPIYADQESAFPRCLSIESTN